MHIVYVEDDPANIALVERVVRMSSDRLTTYLTPQEALDCIHSGDVDLILTDIDFGEGMTGLDLTHELRVRGVRAPIIAITAYDLEEYARWIGQAGGTEFLVKPVEIPALINLLDTYRRAS